MDIEIINILKKHGCLYMADDYKELLTDIQEHYKQDQALQLLQPDVSGSYIEKQIDDAYDKVFKDAMVKYRKD